VKSEDEPYLARGLRFWLILLRGTTTHYPTSEAGRQCQANSDPAPPTVASSSHWVRAPSLASTCPLLQQPLFVCFGLCPDRTPNVTPTQPICFSILYTCGVKVFRVLVLAPYPALTPARYPCRSTNSPQPASCQTWHPDCTPNRPALTLALKITADHIGQKSCS